ncbi:MAG: helix-turn-helix transcriptional regulator, partial [Pseudomonadota bacterium]|nr:helix-turn-helix transcriptional regulator [Pseudomonadota bacterium]
MPDTLPDNINMYVAQKIRELRKQKKINLQKMACYLNISVRSLKQIEKRLTPLFAGLLYKAALVLGVDVGALFPKLPIFQTPNQIRQKKIDD